MTSERDDTVAPAAWPVTRVEAHSWSRSGHEVGSRRRLRAASGPYEAAVPPFIAEQDVSLPAELIAASEDASRELTRFDTEAGTLAAPFASILLRTESASSSEVENLTSSAKQVALAQIGDETSENARLVVGNVAAMEAAISLADHLDANAILTMHRALLEKSNPDIVGRWRDEQVWIGGGSVSSHNVTFIPPHQDRVSALMDDVMSFARRADLPVMAQLAIAHAQFETIHPFPDGNGRTGRALVQAMLRASGVTRNVTVPVSAGLLGDTEGYFRALTAYRQGDVRPIIEAMSEAAFAAIRNGRLLEKDITEIAARWDSAVRARSHSSVHGLKNLLLRQPVVTVKLVARELGVSEPAADSSVRKLVDAGVLTQATAGRRNRHWQAGEVLGALDAFGARARRRRAGGRAGVGPDSEIAGRNAGGPSGEVALLSCGPPRGRGGRS
ncbi:Fic family protein [Labedella endophytica]|uniref:Fic family protein n=1 Tax=Labedella endophytica TaxID=1523160 RepID=A0A3S0WVP9_9MICO|nr:Fic family protein [Labedella endophytica]RUQ98190.1 Fic family protein [Labedella endophytica]